MSGHKRPKIIVPVQRFLDPPTINSNEDSEDETSGGLPSGQKSPPPGWRRKVATLQPQHGKNKTLLNNGIQTFTGFKII
jgi:hypothetical protein